MNAMLAMTALGALALVLAPTAPSHAQIPSAQMPLRCPVDRLPGGDSTPSRTVQLNNIEPQTRSQLQAILTPQQLAALEAALAANSDERAAITALNLSPKQQADVMNVLQSTQHPTTDVLTPAQIEHLRQTLPFRP